jgi:hypothetical protein
MKGDEVAQDKAERRGFPRFPIEATLVLERNKEKYPIRLLDISKTGARFESKRPFSPESLVRILLAHYPVDVPLRALVAWSRPISEGIFEQGAEFINLPSAESLLVSDFIAEKGGKDPARPEG